MQHAVRNVQEKQHEQHATQVTTKDLPGKTELKRLKSRKLLTKGFGHT